MALGSVAILFVASLVYWGDFWGIASLLPASRESVYFRGEYWRLATSILVHADFQHFLANGLVFGVLAFLLYGYYGASVYPGLTFLSGAIVTALALRTYPAQTWLVGASGVVYWMAGFWLALYLMLERRVSIGKRVVRAFGFGVIVLVPTAFRTGGELSNPLHRFSGRYRVRHRLLRKTQRKIPRRRTRRLRIKSTTTRIAGGLMKAPRRGRSAPEYNRRNVAGSTPDLSLPTVRNPPEPFLAASSPIPSVKS